MDEHTAFARLITSLEEAEDAARRIGAFRPDQPWTKVAEGIRQSKELIFHLAMKART